MLSLKFLVYCKKHSAHNEHRDQRMPHMVAYKRLKQWKIVNNQAQKVAAIAYRRWSFTRGSNCMALTGEILVFPIGGRTWRFDCSLI